MMMKGGSTGMPPIQVRIITSAIRVQSSIWLIGRKVMAWSFEVWRMGTARSTRMEANSATTPPSLLGMDRRMAYAKRKYHSGLMWGGVTRGSAGVKLSGSPRRFGINIAREARVIRRIAKPRRSL